MPLIPTDDELRDRLRDAEDALVERKEAAHLQTVKKAAVAFANSLAAGTTGVVFLGVRGDGTPTGKLGDVDALQKQVRGYLSECYPPVPYQLYALQSEGVDVVAVVVSPSEAKPHFTGKAYMRVGSESVEASTEALGTLIDTRNSLIAALAPYVGQQITVFEQRQMSTGATIWDGRQRAATLVEVTPHFVRLRFDASTLDSAISLGRIALEWHYPKTTPARPLLRVSV